MAFTDPVMGVGGVLAGWIRLQKLLKSHDSGSKAVGTIEAEGLEIGSRQATVLDAAPWNFRVNHLHLGGSRHGNTLHLGL